MKIKSSVASTVLARTFNNRSSPKLNAEGKAATKHHSAKQSTADYQRSIDLKRILPLMPQEIDDHSPKGNALIVAKIRSALRSERWRGRRGHWSYNLNRHAALLNALKAEIEDQQKLLRPRSAKPGNQRA